MAQTNTGNKRTLTDDYWKKRYRDAGVVPSPTGGVRVTKPTARMGYDFASDADKRKWQNENYWPVAQAIQSKDPRVVSSATLDMARYGVQNGLISQKQYDWVSSNIEGFRKTLSQTPLTSGGSPVQYGRLGLTNTPGVFGPVKSTLTHSKLIQYNPDGSWEYKLPTSAADINAVTESTRQRQSALINDANPVNVGLETAKNLTSFGLGAGGAVMAGATPGGNLAMDLLTDRLKGTSAFAPDTFGGNMLSSAQGTRVGIGTKPMDYMSGLTQGTSYLGARMAGNTPAQANELAANITQQSPWYQASNDANAPAANDPFFQMGSTFGGELVQAVPAMYSSLGLLNASATLGGRLLAPFGTRASSIGRGIGLTAGVVAPPLVQGFRDQLTGGQPGLREDIVAGYETITDPVRSVAQRGMTESAITGQQTFDPYGRVAGAFQQAGMLAMASGGAVQMWRDVKSTASQGMAAVRSSLQQSRNPFTAMGAGMAKTVESEIGRAAMVDLGFATTQPLSDIGRKIYANMRIDKTVPYDEPTAEDITRSFLLGMVASRPGKSAQWIFRGNPLESMEPKAMAMAHAADIVNKGAGEIELLRQDYTTRMNVDGGNARPNEIDLRRVATVMGGDNTTNLNRLGRMEQVPDGVPVFKTTAEYVEAFLKNPEQFPERLRAEYDALIDGIRDEKTSTNDESVLNDIGVDPAYDTDLMTRRKQIRALTDALLPEYERLFNESKGSKPEDKPNAQYYGIDLGDGNMIVYNRDFSSATMVPLSESPDVVMLKPNRTMQSDAPINTPERQAAYQAFNTLFRVAPLLPFEGDEVAVIGFSRLGLVVRNRAGNIFDVSREQLQNELSVHETAGNDREAEVVSDAIANLDTILKDPSLSTPHSGSKGADKRFQLELPDNYVSTGDKVLANRVGGARGTIVFQGDNGRYYGFSNETVFNRGFSDTGDIYDSDAFLFNPETKRMRMMFTNPEGENFPVDLLLTDDQISEIQMGDIGTPTDIFRAAFDAKPVNTKRVGDIIAVPNPDGTYSRYVVLESSEDYAYGVPVDNLQGIPAMIFDSPNNKTESLNVDFLRKQMEQAQRISGVDASSLRPTGDLISNISRYAFWLTSQDTNTGRPVALVQEIVNASSDELPSIIYDTLINRLDDVGIEQDVTASIREWMLKNPDNAIVFESAMHNALTLELSKPVADQRMDALVKIQKIAQDADLNNILDEIIRRFDTDREVSSDVNYSSSPRRLGRTQGQLQVLLNAADILGRHLRRTGNITDAQVERILRNFLGNNPLFSDNLDNAVATAKRLAKLKSSVNPLALGTVIQKGSIWMLEKMAALPHEVQVLSAYLPYEDMPDAYKSGFGEWFKSKEKYEQSVTYARDLYSRAYANGPEAVENLRSAMYANRLGYFYEIAKGGADLVRPVSVDITDPRANDVLRANLQRSSDSIGEMIQKAATEKLAILANTLNKNKEAPDLASPVSVKELTTAAQLAAPDGVLHPELITDQEASDALVRDPTALETLTDLANDLIDQAGNTDVFDGVSIFQPDEAVGVTPGTIQTVRAGQEAAKDIARARDVFGQLPEMAKSTLLGLASPLMWMVDTIRAVDRSNSNAAREALIAGFINAFGAEGNQVLGFNLSNLFPSDADAQRFQQYATEVMSKIAQSESTGESVETKRVTAIRGAMKELIKLAEFIAGAEGTSIIAESAQMYSRINVIDLKTFIELASKEVIRGLLRNAMRADAGDSLSVINAINSHVGQIEQMARAAHNIVGSDADKSAALNLIHSSSTDGLKYLGVSFDPARRAQISDAVSAIRTRLSQEGSLLSPTQRAQMLLDMANEMKTSIADFILNDRSLEEDTSAAYTPTLSVAADALVNELSSGAQFIKNASGARETAQLLMAGNRAGLEKIILTTLLDAASKDELTYESIDRAIVESVVGPEKTRKYYDRKRNERFVGDKLLFSKTPTMMAAILPGVDGTYTLNGDDTGGLVEGQAMFNLYYDKMMSMLTGRNRDLFAQKLREYVDAKRLESDSQVFAFDVKDLVAIAEGFSETQNGIFKATNDASTFTFGVTGKDAQLVAYRIKSLLASIVGTETDNVAINRTTYVGDQFTGSASRRSLIEQFESVSIYSALDEDVVTRNDALSLNTLYTSLSKQEGYSDREKQTFNELAKHYRSIARKTGDAPTQIANRYADALSVSHNLAKLYDMYAARKATNLISADINGNFNLNEYKALTAFLGLDNSILQMIINANSVRDILNDSVLTKDQQKMLVTLRAAQLKQDFYNQHHQLFFAHESMMADLGYAMVADSNKNIDAFIKPIRVKVDGAQTDAIASLLFMAASKNVGKTALTLTHEVAHHLFYSLPHAQQLGWIRAIAPPLLSKGDGEHVSPEMQLFHDYLNSMNKKLREFSDDSKSMFRLSSFEDFANSLDGQKYTPEQIKNAKVIFGEMAATSMVNFILHSGVVHKPNGTVPVAEDVTATLMNLKSVLQPMAAKLTSEYGPYASIDGKPTNAFYYKPTSVVYETTSTTGVNRKFYPIRHGSFISFINDVGKKYSNSLRTVDVHDVLLANANAIGNRSKLEAVLRPIITDREVLSNLVSKLESLKDRGFVYGKHYRLSIAGDNGFVKQAEGTTQEQGYSAIGKVVGMVRDKTSERNWSGVTMDLVGKKWILDAKTDSSNSPWYGLNIVDFTSGLARIFQRGTRGDYGYVVESNTQLRLNLLAEGKGMDLGADNFLAKDVKVNYIVGHDYIDQSPNFHMVGTSDINNPTFTSLMYNMLGRIDRNIVDIGGQRTYEYELRMNQALADGMRAGNFNKWNEVVSAPLAMALNKDIASVIASTPKDELLAVQNTGTHGWLRNQIHARNLYRWARNIKDSAMRDQAIGLIGEITQQHADTVGKSLSDNTAETLTQKMVNFMSKGLGWYSFIPVVSEKFNDRGIAPIITAVHEQMFGSLYDVKDFVEHVAWARFKMNEDMSSTSLREYLLNPTEDMVNSSGRAFDPRTLTVKIGDTTVDASSLIDQLFGINISDEEALAAYQGFMMQWSATSLRRWVRENNAALDTSAKKLPARLAELYTYLSEASDSTDIAVVDPNAPARPTPFTRTGLSTDYMDAGRSVDVSGVLSYLVSQASTADEYVNLVNYYTAQSDVSQTFSAETALKVMPHAVLDHVFTKIFTNDQQRMNFLQAASGRVPNNGSVRDVINARNMFNVVEHIVRTDAKIRNAALRNWKSYELVDTNVDTGEVIIRSPDRDIAADNKGATKSGALYRINMETGNVSLVAKSKRLNKSTGKYEDSYVDVKDVDDFLRYNYVSKPNQLPKQDPLAFDAADKSIVLSAEQLFGTAGEDLYRTLGTLVGEDVYVHAMANDLPVYFLLPDSLSALSSRDETALDTFENELDNSVTSMHTNNGMHLVKGVYNKKNQAWEFRQAKNNWQSADNYRSQLPLGLLQMVASPFETSSPMTLTREKQQQILQHQMLQEEYHIAKLLLAKDRAGDKPKHLSFNKIGSKSLVPSGGDFLQDASNGTWYSSSPRFVDDTGDGVPVQREQSAVHLNDSGDQALIDSRDNLDQYTRITQKANPAEPAEMTFVRDEKTSDGLMRSGPAEHPVMQVSSNIWDKSVGDFLKGTPYETKVADGEAVTIDGSDLEPMFSASPKLKDAIYNADKHVFQPARTMMTFMTLALDVSSLAVQLGGQIRNPIRLLKGLALTLPEALAFGSADLGMVVGHYLHAWRQANRYANRGPKYLSQAVNLDVRYYNFIMNSIVDRFNLTNRLTKPITMTDLIEKYYMPGAYSDWYRAHKANVVRDPSKYRSIIDTPFTSERENSFANQLPTVVYPLARRFDMARQLLIDLMMVQNALSAVKDARAQKYSKTKKEEADINKDIKAAIMNYGKEFGIGTHAKSKDQAPIWQILAKIAQYPQTAPGYNRSFAQYWGIMPALGFKRKVNEIARVATAGGPKWLAGEVYDIESDERFIKYNTTWARDRMGRDKTTQVAAWIGVVLLNSALNWMDHMKQNPGKEMDATEVWNVTAKRFGYNRLNDNWVFAVPVLSKFGQLAKPLSALADKSNYGPKEKAQGFMDSLVQTYIKNKIHNGGQWVISHATGSTFDKRAAYERQQGLRVAVDNDVRAPMYFHPMGYVMPNQSNLTMDTMTFAHQSQYYDDLLKLAIFSEAAKRGMTLDQMVQSGSIPERITVSKEAANELWWKGTVPRLGGLNIMYEPREFDLVNKTPVKMGPSSSVTLGRLSYMMRNWYKYPNLFQTLRQNPADVFVGYPVNDVGSYALGIPSDESMSKAVMKENIRLPLSNVERSIMDVYRDEKAKEMNNDEQQPNR